MELFTERISMYVVLTLFTVSPSLISLTHEPIFNLGLCTLKILISL